MRGGAIVGEVLVEVMVGDVIVRGRVGQVEIERAGASVSLPAEDRELWRRLRGMLEMVGNEAFVAFSHAEARKP